MPKGKKINFKKKDSKAQLPSTEEIMADEIEKEESQDDNFDYSPKPGIKKGENHLLVW